MHVVVVGDFPPDVRERIRAAFPCRWEIHIVTENEVWDFLQKADVIIPEGGQNTVALEMLIERVRKHLNLVQNQ